MRNIFHAASNIFIVSGEVGDWNTPAPDKHVTFSLDTSKDKGTLKIASLECKVENGKNSVIEVSKDRVYLFIKEDIPLGRAKLLKGSTLNFLK